MDGCLRLGGQHLEEDASDVRDDYRGEVEGMIAQHSECCFFASLASGTERKNPENG